MSNEVPDDVATSSARHEPEVVETSALPLVLIAGDDDLVCVDDTCLPAEIAR